MILVTDAELRHALNIIRSVGRFDEVAAQSRIPFATGFFSKFTKKRIKAELKEINLKDFDVVFLVTDAATELGIKKKLKNALLPSKRQFEIFGDKAKTVELASELNVPVPETRVIKSYEDDFAYPVLVKPAKSSGSRGRVVLRSKEEAEEKLPKLLETYRKLLVQEIVDKKETIGTELLMRDGELFAIFQHKRLREYPVDGGPSTLRVSVKHEKTRELAMRLLEAVNYNGVAMVEFGIRKNNKPVLFEVNPRWWGSLALAIKAGVDFPKVYYELVKFGDAEKILDYKQGVLCKFLLFGDILHFLSKRDFIGFLASLFETKNFDILSLSDPLPALARFPMAMYYLLKPELRAYVLR